VTQVENGFLALVQTLGFGELLLLLGGFLIDLRC
jgi:hypothetical protein